MPATVRGTSRMPVGARARQRRSVSPVVVFSTTGASGVLASVVAYTAP